LALPASWARRQTVSGDGESGGNRRKGKTMAEEVRAPLAGNIWSVLVEPGAKVEEDDELVVIEALKMENPVCAPCSGTVKEVKVKKGDKVAEDDVLVVIG
jgi:biotin carboxyl carrier protein